MNTLRRHWPEYAMEAALLGGFMVSACGSAALAYHPGSPVAQAVNDGPARRVLMGLAMGLTAIALIYSPWGRRSGAHMNPAVTLTFLRLGKSAPSDAAFYIASQFVGGAVGVLTMDAILGPVIANPNVNYVVTAPGRWGVAAAFAGEAAIAFGMMITVLTASNHKALANYTGLFAGALVALFITFEAPVSGMSMNPARTFASAVVAGDWTGFWVYVAAPVLGMLAAAECYVFARGAHRVRCAKLHHRNNHRCIFCEYQHPELAVASAHVRRAPKERS